MVLVSYTNHMPMEVVMPGQVEEDWPTMQVMIILLSQYLIIFLDERNT